MKKISLVGVLKPAGPGRLLSLELRATAGPAPVTPVTVRSRLGAGRVRVGLGPARRVSLSAVRAGREGLPDAGQTSVELCLRLPPQLVSLCPPPPRALRTVRPAHRVPRATLEGQPFQSRGS